MKLENENIYFFISGETTNVSSNVRKKRWTAFCLEKKEEHPSLLNDIFSTETN